VPNSGTAAAPNANVPAVPKPNKPPGLSALGSTFGVIVSTFLATSGVVVAKPGFSRWCY
jgi:hypothetical protein